MTRVFRQYGIFLLIPGVVLAYSLFLKAAAGPYWLATNFDPSYQYFINGLYLVKGFVPNHTDHPGTPLQMLCCIIYWLFNIGRSTPDIVTKVLISPEFYLRVVFVVLSLFSFLTSVALAVYVFRKTNDKLAALLTQLPVVSFLVMKSWETVEPILPVVANVSPEPLLIGVLNLFNICLLMQFFAKTSKDVFIATLCWGFVSGLGVAVKLTFLPLLAIPLIILSWRNKVLFVGIFAASFVLWTLPILSKYHIIWGWISGIAMHKSAYGSNGGSLQEILNYCSNWKNIIIGQWVFTSFLFVSLAIVVWRFLGKKWDRGVFFLAAISLGVFLQFSAVTQHPGAHYLLPGLGVFGALLVLLYLQIVAQHVLVRRITLVFIVSTTLLGAWQASGYCLRLEGLTKGILSFHDHVEQEHPNCTFIDYYRSSDPQAALFFGDGWNLSPHLGQELFGLYPNKVYYHLWGYRMLNFNGTVWANDLLVQNSCVLFRGDANLDFSNGPYAVKLLEKGRFENINLLTGTTEKQAVIFLTGAMQFFQRGDYTKALMCALQARKFHYQPDSDVENLVNLLQPYLQH